ncbi:hypothetical protein GCM10009744_58910 [Kribbella alba]|uniref:Uncharacterized protein n=1 Tax=Kribbella alba TaxID=190197 RepID=A0ABN2FS30_9ACTN
MSTEPQLVRRPLVVARRLITRVVQILLGVIGGAICFFVSQGVFAGYPKYHTYLLTIIGVILIATTGAVAWFIDERRDDADG